MLSRRQALQSAVLGLSSRKVDQVSGFSNAVIGGMQKLIRAAIQSPDYKSGVSGWTVNKDGSAEFNDVSMRGTVVVGEPPDVQIVLQSLAGEGIITLDWNNPNFLSGFITGINSGAGNAQITDLQIVGGRTSADSTSVARIDIESGSPDGSKETNMTLAVIGDTTLGEMVLTDDTLSMIVNAIVMQCLSMGLSGNSIAMNFTFSVNITTPEVLITGKLHVTSDTHIDGTLTVADNLDAGTATVGNYYEEVDLSAENIPSGVANFTTLTNLAAVELIGTSAFNLATGAWTCPEDGVYTFCIGVVYAAWVSNSVSRVQFANSTSGTMADSLSGPNANAGSHTATIRRFVKSGEVVSFGAGQNTGATQTINAASNQSFISVTREING